MLTLNQSLKELVDVLACLGGHLPAVDVEGLLELLDGSFLGHLPLMLQVDLVADHCQGHVLDVQALILLLHGVLSNFIQFSTST